MQLSRDRILTTHVGSLPRAAVLSDMLIRHESGEAVDAATLDREIRAGVAGVLRAQIDAGVDVVNDGEQPRAGFQTYVPSRMTGFGGASKRPKPSDYLRYPRWAEQMAARFPRRAKVSNAPQCVGEIRYGDDKGVAYECDVFLDAAKPLSGRYADAFMTAASPGIIATTMLNAYYDSHERYLAALAREMRREYEYIVARGFVLQIDAPDLAMERTVLYQDKPLSHFLSVIEQHVAALNDALSGIPRDRVRLHACWGNWDGPHDNDVPLADVLPIIRQAKVGALSMEFANARHQHEYSAVRAIGLPAEMALVPGVVDSTSNYVEHPEVIANRICEAVAAVGDRERVIAGTDCGFGTFAGYEMVAPDVVWAKMKCCAEGARIATARLWGRGG